MKEAETKQPSETQLRQQLEKIEGRIAEIDKELGLFRLKQTELSPGPEDIEQAKVLEAELEALVARQDQTRRYTMV